MAGDRGRASSLLVAIGFSLILNLALVSTFVWPLWLGPQLKFYLWPVVTGLWIVGGFISWRFLDQFGKEPESADKTDDTLFIQAQTEYLKGDFTQAELHLAQRLQTEPRDAEARLLLVSLYRRTQREQKAHHQLNNLQRLDASIDWRFEMERERRMLDSQMRQPENEETIQDESSSSSVRSGTIRLGEAAVDLDENNRDEDQTNPNQRAA